MMPIDRTLFFDLVRNNPFPGSLTQEQVDGMNAILDAWESAFPGGDLRWLANALAQTYHEVSGRMVPIEEYQGAQQSYGKVDPETGQAYYGRGLIQCTHRENYRRADTELGLEGDMSTEWHAENMLRPDIASACLFEGMVEGWYRTHDDGDPETLERYFSADGKVNNVFEAREIINGDKNKVPSWSSGASIGELIKGYHEAFLLALEKSYSEDEDPMPGRRLLAEARAKRQRG
jgi:hypothetical protein